jgi:outer membrane protein
MNDGASRQAFSSSQDGTPGPVQKQRGFMMRCFNKNGISRPWFVRAAFLLATAASPAAMAAGGPVDILTAYNDALEGNARHRAIVSEYQAAQQLVPAARGKLLPQVALRARYDWVWEDIEGTYYQIPNVDSNDEYERYAYGGVIEQVLFNGSLFASLGVAKLKLLQAGFALEDAQDDLLTQVVEAYFAVLGAAEGVRFADAEVATLKQQMEQISARADAGLAIDADRQGAVAAYELALARKSEAQTLMLTSELRLEALTGKQYDGLKLLPPDVPLSLPQPLDENDWIARARTHNAQVLGRAAGVEVAKKEMQQARRQRWPRLNAQGAMLREDFGGGVAGDRVEEEERVGLVLDLPIYSGGQVSAGIEASKSKVAQAEALLEDARTQAVRETRIAHLQITSGLVKAQGLKRAVDAAIAAEAATQSAYEAGTRTSADLLQAIETRYDAERNYAVVRYRILLSGIQLRRASGTLVTADLIDLNRQLQVSSAGSADMAPVP